MRRSLLLAFAFAALAFSAVEDPIAAARQMRERQDAETLSAALAWLRSADLSPIPVPVLGKDPRASELSEVQAVTACNSELKDWAFWRDQQGKGNKDSEEAIRNWWRALGTNMSGADTMRKVLAHKGAATNASAAPAPTAAKASQTTKHP